MSFFSTRGESCVTASQAILYGLAPDGGLYVPAMFPTVPMQRITSFCEWDYPTRAVSILKRYLEDFSIPEIEEAVRAAYSAERFDTPQIAPVKQIDDATWVLELFHGPTLAFKDMALQLLPHLTRLSALKNGEKREVSILVATSGDTGKAALEGFRDVPGTSCTVFYPLDGVSDVQRLQMVTTGGNNTHVIAVKGNFDDAQTGVKELFSSREFIEAMDGKGKILSSANSINFGRLVPQIVYYFKAYSDLLALGRIKDGVPVNFTVPTGNFGDILAGFFAKKLGLPVGKLICASNANNVLTDFLKTGVYDRNRSFFTTISPSMDILISSNLERLLYHLSGNDDEKIRGYMAQLKETGRYQVDGDIFAKLQSLFEAGCCDDAQTKATIGEKFRDRHYLCDTHTAVAVRVYDDYRASSGDRTPCVIASTASPFKFCASVLAAIDPTLVKGEEFEMTRVLEQTTGVACPAQLAGLEKKTIRFTDVRDKNDMRAAVYEMLHIQ